MKLKKKIVITSLFAVFGAAIALTACSGDKGYTVSFNTNGGTPLEPIKVQWGEKIYPKETTKTGYSFGAWFFDEALSRQVDLNTYTVSDDLTLFASWRINQYKLQFETNGGTPVAEITRDYNLDVTTQETTTTKEGYTFGGWYFDAALTEANKFNYKIPASNSTLYAAWLSNKVSFNFHSSGGTGSMNSAEIQSTATGTKLPACNYSLEGHSFVGWALTEGSSEVVYRDQQAITLVQSVGAVDLYAVWVPNNYSLKFTTGGLVPEYDNKDVTLPVTYGELVDFPTEEPSLVGNSFNGWGYQMKEAVSFVNTENYFDARGNGYAYDGEVDATNFNEEARYVVDVCDQFVYERTGSTTFYACFVKEKVKVNYYDTLTNLPFAQLPQQEAVYGETITLPTPVMQPGYSFNGWYYKLNGNNIMINGNTFSIPDHNVDLYTSYTHHNLIVNYHANTGTGSMEANSFTMNPGQEFKLAKNTFVKEGYSFNGWDNDAAGKTVRYTDEEILSGTAFISPNSTLELYAVWGVNSYTISLDPNGGTSSVTTLTGNYNETITTPENPTKEGNKFLGWFEEGSEVAYSFNKFEARDITLKAKWEVKEYLVSFESNGGTPVSAFNVLYGELITEPTAPTKEGYTFAGWCYDKELQYNFNFGVITMPAKDSTLYAKWTPAINTVTIKIYKETLEGTFALANTLVDSETYVTGQTTTYIAPAQTGYSAQAFEQVQVKADGTSVVNVYYKLNEYSINYIDYDTGTPLGEESYSYKYGQTIGAVDAAISSKLGYTVEFYALENKIANISSEIVSGNKTYRVKYTAIPYSITLNTKGGELQNGVSPIVSSIGQNIDLTQSQYQPTKTGYTFEGWYESEDCSGSAVTSYTMPNNNVMLYAKWSINQYTVTINYNDGVTPQSVNQRDYQYVVDLSSHPSKEGYTFEKWTANGSNIGDSFTVGAANVTIEAVFVPNKIVVNYHANGALGTMESSSLVFDVNKQLPANTYTKTGYTFAGWATSEVLVGTPAYLDEATLPNSLFTSTSGTLELYALFTPNEYAITFNYGDGRPTTSETKDYATYNETEQKYERNVWVSPSIPTREGYSFAGWYDNNNQLFIFGNEIEASSFTLTAHWTKDTYFIYFEDSTTPAASFEYETDLSEYVLPTPTNKTGYTFGGWYADALLTEEFVKPATMPGNDIHVYAKWIPIDYTIYYYDVDTGIEYTDLRSVNGYNTEINEPETPVKTGYVFLGWYTGSYNELTHVLTDATYYSFYKMPNNNLKLYALWEASITYTYNYVVDGKTVYSTTSDAAIPNYTGLVKEYYDQYTTLDYIYNGIGKAAAGDTSYLTAVITFATIDRYDYNGTLVAALVMGQGLDQTACQAALMSCLVNLPRTGTTPLNMMIYDSAITDGDTFASELAAHGAIFYFDGTTFVATGTYLGTTPMYFYLGQVSNAQYYQKAAALAATPSVPAALELISAASLNYDGTNPVLVTIATALSANPQDTATLAPYFGYMTLDSQFQGNEDALKIFMIKTALGTLTDVSVEVYTKLKTGMPYGMNENVNNYYDFLAQNAGKDPDALAQITSNFRAVVGEVYENYVKSAYLPYDNIANRVFDGWSVNVDRTNHIKTYTATWVSPIGRTPNLSVTDIKSNSVTFVWDSVDNAYGYEVIITKGEEVVVDTNVVATNTDKVSYTLTNVKKDEEFVIDVITISKDGSQNARLTSKLFSAENFDGSGTIYNTPISLSSLPTTTSYVHTIDTDVEDIKTSGEYYYIGSGDTIYMFTNMLYTFNGKYIAIVEGFELEGVQISTKTSGGRTIPALEIGNNSGTFKFKISTDPAFPEASTTIYTAKVNPLISSMDYGIYLSNYQNLEYGKEGGVGFDSTFSTQYSFYGEKKDDYTIGRAITTVTTGSLPYDVDYYGYEEGNYRYYNGVKFDFEAVSTSGNKINEPGFKLVYSFKDANGNPVATKDIAKYDEENDVFYFTGATGKYTVTVTPDVTSDKSVFVPQAYKDNPAKMAQLTTSFTFTLNEGVNVYTCDCMRSAFGYKGVTSINVQQDIRATLNAASVLPLEYYHDTGTTELLIDDSKGELDIVTKTAIMSTDGKYGPKIWSLTPTSGTSFVAADEKTYYYAGENESNYCVKSAEFVNNKTDLTGGKFKICNCTIDYEGIVAGNILSRYGKDFTVNDQITVNGNYFTLDGSKIPYFISTRKNTAGGSIKPNYDIQSVVIALISNVSDSAIYINDFNLVGNSQNTSALYDETASQTESIADQMSRMSGGINGIVSRDRVDVNVNPNTYVKSVNISDTLIPLYCDGNMVVSYSYINNSWASSMFGYAEFASIHGVDHSYIGSSGGPALDIEDQIYTLDTLGYVTNPTLTFDPTNTCINNFVSGEEQWFKAYGMEVTALGLKGQINTAVNALGYTVIKKVVDPITNLETEKMNLVFFGKSGNIENQGSKSLTDINVNFSFGKNYQEYQRDDSKNSVTYVEMDPTNNDIMTTSGKTVTQCIAAGEYDFTVYAYNRISNSLNAETNYRTYTFMTLSLHFDPASYNPSVPGSGIQVVGNTISHMYFYFEMDMIATMETWVYGMLEMWAK